MLLEGVAADPSRPVSAYPLLSEDEREKLLVDWNQTALDYPRESCLPQVFEVQVARTPDAVAAACEGESITYADLYARAIQLAHYLRGLGVGPDVLVGVYVERSIEMMVALLGVHKAGGAYVPLDPTFPRDRLAYMIADSGAGVLLTQDRLVPELPPHQA
ncbi:MAG: AMP-binding protein, partial [Chloroflexota bacterium]